MKLICTILFSVLISVCFSQTNRTDTIVKKIELQQSGYYIRYEIVGKDTGKYLKILTKNELEKFIEDSLNKFYRKIDCNELVKKEDYEIWLKYENQYLKDIRQNIKK